MINSPDKQYDLYDETRETSLLQYREVSSINDLNQLLINNYIPDQILMNDKIQQNLTNLIDRAHKTHKRLFVLTLKNKLWAVLASSDNEVQQNQVKIEEISELQSSINGESLWGQCIYVHEFASALGITNGNMFAGGRNGDPSKSIYPIRGIHKIGYSDMPEQNNTIYFDLTAKPYVFTCGQPVDNAIMEGVIIVEQLGQTQSIESLYQTGWQRNPFQPEQTSQNHILQQGRTKFIKQN